VKAILEILGFVLLGLFVALTLLWLLAGGPSSCHRRSCFDRAVESVDQRALLAAAVDVIRQTTNHMTFNDMYSHYPSLTNLPPIIHKMKPNYVSVDPYSMQIEFHGGFDHYGFRIKELADAWKLSRYTEDGEQEMIRLRIENAPGESATRGDAIGRHAEPHP